MHPRCRQTHGCIRVVKFREYLRKIYTFYETIRVGNSIIGFSFELIVFGDHKIDLIVKKIESFPSIF